MTQKEEIIEVTNETEIEVTSVMVSSLIHIMCLLACKERLIKRNHLRHNNITNRIYKYLTR